MFLPEPVSGGATPGESVRRGHGHAVEIQTVFVCDAMVVPFEFSEFFRCLLAVFTAPTGIVIQFEDDCISGVGSSKL